MWAWYFAADDFQTNHACPYLLSVFAPLQYSKHLFVHIGQTNPSYSDPLLEAVDIRQIYDKFPEKKGGLKELYEKGPQNAFFLVKFWVGWWTHVILCWLLDLCAVVFLLVCLGLVSVIIPTILSA